MKANLLFILFALITSLEHQPNLRFYRDIPRRRSQQAVTAAPIETDAQQPNNSDAQAFYDNPPEKYKYAKEHFDKGNRFDDLMRNLQNNNAPVSDAYYLCEGYNPREICESFIDEIAKRL